MNTEFWHLFEIVVITIVIIIQIIHTILVNSNILKLKRVFLSKLFLRNAFIEKGEIGKVDFDSEDIHYEDNIDLNEKSVNTHVSDDVVKLSLVDTKGSNETINKVKVAINTYLINNFGAAVNFSIIKDIVDREINVKDEEITQSVTLPLYLGLASTMIGIIFGLFSMPVLNGSGFLNGVNALIGGVKIAMIGSLSGLVCTVFLSSFSYKKANRIVQKDKNEILTYLQAKLLPELIKAEDTGVSGLKASLDKFARVATTISDNVLIAANQTGENLVLQQEVMEKVENMKVLKISKWNLELFERLEKNMESFNNFAKYLSNMEIITNQLSEFADKTSDVDKIINGIDKTLKESRELTRFLSAHFEKIETAGDAALKSVGLVETHFEDAIESLKTRTDEMIERLYKSAGIQESQLEEIYKEIYKNIEQITSKYITSFSDAYSNSIPKFEQLVNLGLLPEIKEEFLSKVTDFQDESGLKIQTLIEIVNELDASLKSVQNKLNSQVIINKLESIDEKLKKKTSKNTNHTPPNGKMINEKFNDDSLSIGKVIKKLF